METVPTKNKVVGVTQIGGTDKLQRLEVDLPALQPTQILIENHHVSLNPLDVKLRAYGLWYAANINEKTPLVPGCDGVGRVVKVGAEVTKFKEGDIVFYMTLDQLGNAAQYVVVDNRVAALVPKAIKPEEAAAIPVAYGTPLEAYTEDMGISLNPEENRGKTILIIGAGGGVGSAAVQVAKILGLTVVGTASREDTIAYARKLGADYVINHRNPLNEELAKLGGEVKGFDYVFNTADMTNEYYQNIAKVLNPFGVICGITGYYEPINLGSTFTKRPRVCFGVFAAKYLMKVKLETYQQFFETLARWYDENKLVPTVTVTKPFTLENLAEGHKALESGTMIGKYVLTDVNKYFQ